jgi:hypothetical protein
MNANVKIDKQDKKIVINLDHSLDKNMYNLPLTLKTYIDPAWKTLAIKQAGKSIQFQPAVDDRGSYILYQALASGQPIEISPGQ